MPTMNGGCYCGNITVQITTDTSASDMVPRACDCDFCTSHGTEWVSTSDAVLEIEIQNEAALSLYSQGSDSARFWICQRCGVVTAGTCDIDGKRKGAVNRRVLTNKNDFPAAEIASPKTLSAEEKKERWEKVWIQDVVIKDCWDVGL